MNELTIDRFTTVRVTTNNTLVRKIESKICHLRTGILLMQTRQPHLKSKTGKEQLKYAIKLEQVKVETLKHILLR